ncbi:hypothetical protein [Cellulomonas sp. Leaf395]|uniref:hypothetical protein n=1 Tax=Cellulomonas sp. Leaf395 TaxID=1736362 RepID=UPI0012F78910|nr:hypothetical protein [Cellulomonas sp. Leaf395]
MRVFSVELGGAGFTLHAAEGPVVTAGQVVVSWDASALGGRSPVCPVVALDAGAMFSPPPRVASIAAAWSLLCGLMVVLLRSVSCGLEVAA